MNCTISIRSEETKTSFNDVGGGCVMDDDFSAIGESCDDDDEEVLQNFCVPHLVSGDDIRWLDNQENAPEEQSLALDHNDELEEFLDVISLSSNAETQAYACGFASHRVDDEVSCCVSNKKETKLFSEQWRADDEVRNSSNLVTTAVNDILVSRRARGFKSAKSTPKRPLSAYNLFFQRERSRILREQEAGGTGHQISFQELGKLIGKLWHSLAAADRKELEKLSAIDSKRYRREMDIYESHRRAMLSAVCRADPCRSNFKVKMGKDKETTRNRKRCELTDDCSRLGKATKFHNLERPSFAVANGDICSNESNGDKLRVDDDTPYPQTCHRIVSSTEFSRIEGAKKEVIESYHKPSLEIKMKPVKSSMVYSSPKEKNHGWSTGLVPSPEVQGIVSPAALSPSLPPPSGCVSHSAEFLSFNQNIGSRSRNVSGNTNRKKTWCSDLSFWACSRFQPTFPGEHDEWGLPFESPRCVSAPHLHSECGTKTIRDSHPHPSCSRLRCASDNVSTPNTREAVHKPASRQVRNKRSGSNELVGNEPEPAKMKYAPISFLDNTVKLLPDTATEINPVDVSSSRADLNGLQVMAPDETGINRLYNLELKVYKLSNSDADQFIQRLCETNHLQERMQILSQRTKM